MTIRTDQDTDAAVVCVEATLRAPLTSELRDVIHALIRRGERRVLLDLTTIDFIDAAGVGELVHAFRAVQRAGGVLRIAHENRRVRRVLRIAGLLGLLTRSTEASFQVR